MGEGIKNASISVIIPAYNAEKTIIPTLKSVINQSRRDLILEVLVINDGSTDKTEELIKQFISKNLVLPIILFNKENGGVSSARNVGLKHAKGEWIALLDSDDEWFDKKLEIQSEVIKKNPQIDLLGGNHLDKPISILGKKITTLYRPTIQEILIKSLPQPSTAIFRRKIYEEIGGYDESRNYAEDGQFFNKICVNYNFYYIPDQLVIYDNGKRGFGVRGLSGNIVAMQDGIRKNLKELRERKDITLLFYIFITIFSELKYFRRIVLTKLSK
ncbi:glycosyltransferase family 2 protein [Streptococcus sp. CSL10205-OR2]|uniref:glycosyltransferase family 2 protein n=1 Tax=Streptococcus sp. CSL10205-OR2 TaxID=2980558 RepID=UPI0021DB6FBD|nr:glycosyltransferase family A protein [Streptococcus sp. CSL10205-OR2]MCU9533609.1 glycosyltransferase family 2 protein [Streptococcus sp. CSL10205-OR2]